MNRGLVIGIVAVIIVVLGLGIFLVVSGDDDDGGRSSTTTSGIPAATQDPDGLGDDPELDELAEGCFEGDMDACDDLYMESDFGSDYEDYGDTCAGRQDPDSGALCAVAFPED